MLCETCDMDFSEEQMYKSVKTGKKICVNCLCKIKKSKNPIYSTKTK